MKVNRSLFSLSNNRDSIIAAIICFILIQIFSKHSGIGISPDSVTYICASRYFLEGQGFISYDHLPVVVFPVLYPCFLSVITWITHTDPVRFGGILNGFLFGCMIYTAGAIMNGFKKYSPWYKRILLCCFVFSWAFQEVYSYLWSETIFIIQILIFIVVFSKYLRSLKTEWLLIAALVCSVTCLTRYAGIFLIFTGVALIFLNFELPLKKRIFHCFFYGAISVLIFAIQIVRNLKETGLATGSREKSNQALLATLANFGDVISDWLSLSKTTTLSTLLALSVLMVFLLSIFLNFKKKNNGYQFEYLFAFAGFIYCVFMILTAALSRYEQFTNRLLAPMLIPLLWSLSSWIPGFIEKRKPLIRLICLAPLLFLTAGFINIQLRLDYENYDGVKDAGIPGYTEDPFVNSEIVQYLKKNISYFKPGPIIYSNASDALYFVTGLNAQELPRSYFPKNVERYYKETNSYLVWFYDLENPELPDLKTILAHKNLLLWKEFPDGAVYFEQ
jgi:hypothetical protein